ncbi:MAG: proline hydroxylase, partial [Collimonas sp.]
MNTLRATADNEVPIAERIGGVDWDGVARNLDDYGSALLAQLLTPQECQALIALYARKELFRSRIVMERHGFGRG